MRSAHVIIHNGAASGSLPVTEFSAQLPLAGEGMVRFGTKTLQFNGEHFRLFQGHEDLVRLRNGLCLSVSLGNDRSLDRLGGELMSEVRYPVSREMLRLAHQLKREHVDRSLPVVITRLDEVQFLREAVLDQVRRVARRIDRLPGRALYKRIDTYLRLERAHDYIQAHYLADPTTDRLAEEAAISRAHFIRLFGAFYAISPKQLVLDLKMREAKKLLRETRLSIWEVAEASGFNNRCAFQRMFRQREGLTPGRFRSSAEA